MIVPYPKFIEMKLILSHNIIDKQCNLQTLVALDFSLSFDINNTLLFHYAMYVLKTLRGTIVFGKAKNIYEYLKKRLSLQTASLLSMEEFNLRFSLMSHF